MQLCQDTIWQKLSSDVGIKERGQPATSPIVEEINIGHVETGWSVRVRNRMVSEAKLWLIQETNQLTIVGYHMVSV